MCAQCGRRAFAIVIDEKLQGETGAEERRNGARSPAERIFERKDTEKSTKLSKNSPPAPERETVEAEERPFCLIWASCNYPRAVAMTSITAVATERALTNG